jgi:hypothetical protein
MAEPSDPSRYPETQLREIIARAAASDQPLYSSREIRAIGAELGIEASVIDTAIVEVNESGRRSESRALGFVRYASYGATLGFIGATSLLTPGVESLGIITCGAMIGLSIRCCAPFLCESLGISSCEIFFSRDHATRCCHSE